MRDEQQYRSVRGDEPHSAPVPRHARVQDVELVEIEQRSGPDRAAIGRKRPPRDRDHVMTLALRIVDRFANPGVVQAR